GFSSGFYLGLPTSDDFSKTENSEATEKKHFVGKVTHYFPKAQVAAVKLSSELKVGDNIIVIGDETGIQYSKVEKIEINNQPINKATKGQEVGIKLPPVKKNDEVYVLLKN
ncbi:MAG: U32 family peptidase, partial [Nanoarchaeota archaeon]|nr:U32 family peptidase [Nanoarchaeota archaeon]